MKILHILNSLSEGGVEMLLLDILPQIKEMGHTVHILVLSNKKTVLKPLFESRGIEVYCSRYSSEYNPLNVFEIAKYSKGYDIVHAHHFPTQYLVALSKWLAGGRRHYVTTEHSSFNNRRKYKIFKYIDRIAYKAYNTVIAISEGTRKNLQQWSGTNSKLIYNGICFARFEHVTPVKREELGIGPLAKILIMVARFSSPKDQDTIIRAVARTANPEIHLVLVGTGERMNECQQLAEELKVSDQIHFIGYSQTPERYIAMADIGILSSQWEGFGISVLEYMVMGKPAIVSDLDGIREVVEDAAVLIKPQSESDMGSAIYRLLQDKNLYRHFQIQGQRQAEKFSSKTTAQQYAACYEMFSGYVK